MLIVEGGDLVGKTTFCNALLKDPRLSSEGYWYNHLTRPPAQGFDGCLDYFAQAWRRYVQDRFHMSEIIYANLRGEQESMCSPEKYRLVDAQLRMLGAFTVIVCCEDDNMIAERHKARAEEEMYDETSSVIVNKSFKRLSKTGRFNLGGHVYTPDFDYTIVTDAECPFPTEYHVQEILRRYTRRQAEVQFVLGTD